MSEPVVSVVIPAHNAERFIGEAIDSVLAQTMGDFELVIVDDGSTDRTSEIIGGYRDGRIVHLHRGKIGVCAASNLALETSRATWAARLDADDVMEPNRLERQLAFLRDRPELGGAASYHWWIDERGEKKGAHDPPLHTVEDIDRHLRLGGRLIYAHPTVMVRRDVVLSLGGYDPAYESTEDVELFVRLYEAGRPLVVQPERLTRFRVHGGSVSATRAKEQFLLNELIFENFRRRRAGAPTITLEDLKSRLATRPVYRWTSASRFASKQLNRRRLLYQMRGRRLAAGISALAIVATDPAGAIARLRRDLKNLNPPAANRR